MQNFPKGTTDCDYCRYVTEALVMIQEVNDILLDALQEYGEHLDDCKVEFLPASKTTINCSCGLDKTFEKVEKKFH